MPRRSVPSSGGWPNRPEPALPSSLVNPCPHVSTSDVVAICPVASPCCLLPCQLPLRQRLSWASLSLVLKLSCLTNADDEGNSSCRKSAHPFTTHRRLCIGPHLSLELGHGSLSCRALHKLAEAAALVSGHLGVNDLSKTAKHVAQVLLRNARAQAPNEDRGVRGVEVRRVGYSCPGATT